MFQLTTSANLMMQGQNVGKFVAQVLPNLTGDTQTRTEWNSDMNFFKNRGVLICKIILSTMIIESYRFSTNYNFLLLMKVDARY